LVNPRTCRVLVLTCTFGWLQKPDPKRRTPAFDREILDLTADVFDEKHRERKQRKDRMDQKHEKKQTEPTEQKEQKVPSLCWFTCSFWLCLLLFDVSNALSFYVSFSAIASSERRRHLLGV